MHSFRLRFHFREGDRVGIDALTAEILTREKTTWTLKSGESDTPISAHSHASIIAKDFPSESEARAAGQACRDAMLTWAVSQRRGIDLGNDSARVVATDVYLARLGTARGVPARNDLHGLDIFPSAPHTAFVRIEGDATMLKDGQLFIDELAGLLASPPKISQKVSLASELFTSSLMDGASRSRFITLTSAVEALLEPKQHGELVQKFVDETKGRLDSLQIPKEIRDSLNGTVRWLRQESIGRAGQQLASELLGSQTYAGQAPDSFFRDCYRIRSQLVHEGGSGLAPQELRKQCDWLGVFVGDLLNQKIFGSINRQPVVCGFEQYEDGSVRWKMLE